MEVCFPSTQAVAGARLDCSVFQPLTASYFRHTRAAVKVQLGLPRAKGRRQAFKDKA